MSDNRRPGDAKPISVVSSRLGYRIHLPSVWAAGVLVSIDEAAALANALVDALAWPRSEAAKPADDGPLRNAVREMIAEWKDQAMADENGWSFRRGNNTFNEGAAFVLRHGIEELEAMLVDAPKSCPAEASPKHPIDRLLAAAGAALQWATAQAPYQRDCRTRFPWYQELQEAQAGELFRSISDEEWALRRESPKPDEEQG